VCRGKGATRATWRDYNPRVLVKYVMDGNPRAGIEDIRDLVRARLAGIGSNYQESFDNYCTDNMYKAIVDDARAAWAASNAALVGEVEAPQADAPFPADAAKSEFDEALASADVADIAEKAAAKKAAVIAEAAAREQRIASMIVDIKSIIIMEMVSPLGKVYGDHTFAEMATIGGWAASISKRGKPTEIVRNKLNEADLHKARGF
jgi:hypothetical protein